MNAVEAYVEARVAYEDAQAKADAAFARWFSKRQNGEPTNGAQATRLSNEANYLSAELYSAEGPIYELGLDPETVWKEAIS